MTPRTILIIDDEGSIRSSLGGALRDEGYLIVCAASGKEGLEICRRQRVALVLLDVWMPEMDGLQTLQALAEEPHMPCVIVMSGHGNIETAVRATKLGAFDFVEKPLSLEKLLVTIQNALSLQDLTRENRALRQKVKRDKNQILVGGSPAMRQIQAFVDRVAPTTGSVLITGENGTGKELVAQSLHAQSPRYARPFIEVNCAAIPEELIESELFGHEKGSFTGATQMRRGKFDLAHHGTLFLDEIADMSLKTQAKVLRILQEQKFERLGGSQTISVDVRIVAATNKDLRAEILSGKFREDLYYRLNVVPCLVPPLRERREDIGSLSHHFLQLFAVVHSRPVRALSAEAERVLQAQSWPGNVRELKNLMERLVILTPSSREDLPISGQEIEEYLGESLPLGDKGFTKAGPTQNLRDARLEFERAFIERILNECEGNIPQAAQRLGIERSYLYRRIRAFENAESEG